jgi:hypothetical protein
MQDLETLAAIERIHSIAKNIEEQARQARELLFEAQTHLKAAQAANESVTSNPSTIPAELGEPK